MPALDQGWELASTEPGACSSPPGDGLAWLPAAVPGTVAGALAAVGRDAEFEDGSIDGLDWWFRCAFEADAASRDERVTLELGGVATVWELFLNGERVGAGESMFCAQTFEVGELLRGHNELALCCRALAPLLEVKRRPRARWRPRIAAGALRFHRTALLGRAPGFAPYPPAIGPWRGVELHRGAEPRASDVRWRPRPEGGDGVVAVGATLAGEPSEVSVEIGGHRASLVRQDGDRWEGELRVPGAERWWPHTHGEPVLHEARLVADGREVARRRLGFRELSFAADFERDGLDIHVNGVAVFARGAVWTPVDPLGLNPSFDSLRAALIQARDAGMNMLRVPGISSYESPAFHELCDELGVLVWQDFMFANFDYPVADDAFRAAVETEARQVLDRLAGSPSLAVLCGNSEVEQQAAMLGLPPDTGRGELFGELLPGLVAEADVDAAWVPSAPCGGDLPFTPSAGVANYFGVGGYRRPLSDARLSAVRFASECLAFANPPDGMPVDGTGVPRDVGSDWDFADVRDSYLAERYGLAPKELAAEDPDFSAALARAVPGEVMAEVMGEWRREGSPCRGALVLWLRDVVPGAGWGLVAHDGAPKEPLHHLRRAWAPVAIWTTDEGMAGIGVHVANDRPEPLEARVRVTLYRDRAYAVEEAEREIAVEPHGSWTAGAEALLGGFRDVNWVYQFGAPPFDAVVVTLLAPDGTELSRAVRFPEGQPWERETAEDLGLSAALVPGPAVVLSSSLMVHGVRLHVPGFTPADDAFFLEPGRERTVALSGPGEPAGGRVTAVTLRGELEF